MARRTYQDERIRVHWNSERCVHVARCLRALPSVFDVQRRPWVDLDGSDDAQAIADAVELCPTGALLYERLDAPPAEPPSGPARIVVARNGPLLARGNLRVESPTGELIAHETRLALCRCGSSRNQPFCDNSHRAVGFKSGPANAPEAAPPAPETESGATTIVPREDASLRITGNVEISTPRGEVLAEAGDVLLCRCGNSRNKPFCDTSHDRVGFCSREPEVAADRVAAQSPASFESNADL